jgi:hypothetical protein
LSFGGEMKRFKYESMLEILTWCEDSISKLDSSDILDFQIPDSNLPNSPYPYYSFSTWGDLATLLFCRMLTPHIDGDFITIRFQKLDISNSFHKDIIATDRERYGIESKFAQIDKIGKPTFLFAYREALLSVKIAQKSQILNLGINSGDEFKFIRDILSKDIYDSINFVGIDYSLSAIQRAKERFDKKNNRFYCQDINHLSKLDLPKSDLIISIGTLQSRDIEFKPLFMSLVQNYLTDDGSMILGFPNSRWIDGEMIYGAMAKNYSYSEMSVLYKDVNFCKKYLQQKKFRVTITGKDYIFLTATSIRK